jgi:hypothetical protein
MRASPGTFLVLKDLAVARVIRERQAVGGPLSSLHAGIARGESGLILQVFGDQNQEVDKDVLRSWLIDGRLSGCWESSGRRIGIRTTSSMGKRIADVMNSTRNPKHTLHSSMGSYYFASHLLGRELRLLAFGSML